MSDVENGITYYAIEDGVSPRPVGLFRQRVDDTGLYLERYDAGKWVSDNSLAKYQFGEQDARNVSAQEARRIQAQLTGKSDLRV